MKFTVVARKELLAYVRMSSPESSRTLVLASSIARLERGVNNAQRRFVVFRHQGRVVCTFSVLASDHSAGRPLCKTRSTENPVK